MNSIMVRFTKHLRWSKRPFHPTPPRRVANVKIASSMVLIGVINAPTDNMNEDPLNYGPLYEAPPVNEEDYDLDVPDEPSPCENCIFYGSIMCEICTIQDK